MSVRLMVHVNHIQWKHQHSGRNTDELWVKSPIWSYRSYRRHRKWNSPTCLCERKHTGVHTQTHTNTHWVQFRKERVKVRCNKKSHVTNPERKTASETSLSDINTDNPTTHAATLNLPLSLIGAGLSGRCSGLFPPVKYDFSPFFCLCLSWMRSSLSFHPSLISRLIGLWDVKMRACLKTSHVHATKRNHN